MPWVTFDDDLNDHPKIIAAGPLAELLYRRAINYSSRHLTDGFVSHAVISNLVAWRSSGFYRVLVVVPEEGMHEWGEMNDDRFDQHDDGCRYLMDPLNVELARRLVRVGLFEEAVGGYRIHDYLHYNRSKEQVLADRAKARARMGLRRSESRSPEVRANFARSSVAPSPPPSPYPSPKSLSESEDVGNIEPTPPSAHRPEPTSGEMFADQVPVVAKKAASGTAKKPKKPKVVYPPWPNGFEEFWKDYPRPVGKIQAADTWRARGLDTDFELRDRIMAALKRVIVEWASRDKDKKPYPSTWLNTGPEHDEPDRANGAGEEHWLAKKVRLANEAKAAKRAAVKGES